MEQKLFTELRTLYQSGKDNASVIRINMRMSDSIEPDALRHAVSMTMKRYPYFCVELQNKEGSYVFAENHRPVIITNSLRGVDLNSEESNFHMIAFAWHDDKIILDVFHALTDGTGAYELLRTLLYYYCSERYHAELNRDGIRLAGDDIPIEEWNDPVLTASELPVPTHTDISKALNPAEYVRHESDNVRTVYSVSISESEFMRFVTQHNGTPGTMTALFLSRAVAKLYPDSEDAIRIALCVNQRKALHAPLAHQTLVGGVMLEYKDKMRNWPLEKQVTAYRGMVIVQTQEEKVLAGVNSLKGINQLLLSMKNDNERLALAGKIIAHTFGILTATVSYVGKGDFKESEKYIRDFHLWTYPGGGAILIEISAVSGRFTFDIMQHFSSPVYVNAFLKELEDNGINYDFQSVNKLELPKVKLSWNM